MKLLLRDDVDGLGKRGDLVEVSDGYGRNYLVPRGLALPATDGIQAQADAMRRSRDQRVARERGSAEEVAKALVGHPITIPHRAADGGKLYGSVTVAEIADAVLAQKGIELDRRALSIDEPIRELGTYNITAKLHAEVQFPITVEVTEEH
jgi:large subunit ribosomal protein L9